MSTRRIIAYIYLAACVTCAGIMIGLIAANQEQLALWLLVIVIPLWAGGIVWSILVRR